MYNAWTGGGAVADGRPLIIAGFLNEKPGDTTIIM